MHSRPLTPYNSTVLRPSDVPLTKVDPTYSLFAVQSGHVLISYSGAFGKVLLSANIFYFKQ